MRVVSTHCRSQKHIPSSLHCVLLFCLVMLVGNCATGQQMTRHATGNWVSSMEVTEAFESAQVFLDHTYYYVGSIAKPDGVIAIDNRYRLKDNTVWAKVEVNETTLKNWQGWWRADTFHHCRYLGGFILTPDGQQAGYWYSPFRDNRVEMPEPDLLIIHRPRSITGASDCEDGGRGFNFFWLD
ncbi:MAG: hypothetical protein HQQ73_09965 [Desulfobulbaceae bacterium]|nr:hypothetical protein [Desulfobulbaceae bacterium]